ncbi:hypothetical protein CPC08DRAFT_707612 [Agrocybe pediades]|nr:hypothetical protein CPC08DRAFT_707612 [Agrocybe pediades]
MPSVKNDTALIDAFLVLQITGAVAFAIIVLSACIFRQNAKRHPIWFSFCVSWILFGISYSFLLFAGQQFKLSPKRIPCTIQAGLVYAAPYLVMGTTIGLIVHLLLNVLAALSQSPKRFNYRNLLNGLVVFPWTVWVAAIVGLLVFGFSHPDQVGMSPNGTYCVIMNSSIPKITSVSATVACTIIIAIEFVIGTLLYRNRAIVNVFSQSLVMAVRILIFTILGFGALGIGLVFVITRTRGAAFDLVISVLPPAAAFTFGTQTDLLKGWLFWKRAQPEVGVEQSVLTLTTVASNSSQIFPAHAAKEPIQSNPAPPYLKLANASSFLNF